MSQAITADLFQAVLLGYLRKYATGRTNAHTQNTIASDLRRLGLTATTRSVRDALAALASSGWPVATTAAPPAGAFLCVTRQDFLAGYNHLAGRLRAQGMRCRRFRETARAALNGQTVFNFAEAEGAFYELEGAPLLAATSGRGPLEGKR